MFPAIVSQLSVHLDQETGAKLNLRQNIDFCRDMKMSFQLEEGGSIAREVEVSISLLIHFFICFITAYS